MIIKQYADDIIKASYEVTTQLVERHRPSKKIVIKPNIVEPAPPPVTTDVRIVEGITKALADSGINEVIIAEGSGTGDTLENFRALGYAQLGVRLIDLDRTETVELAAPDYSVWEYISVPKILLDKFIISVPVLKEHSMCGVTISLKNMIGVLPANYYSGYWSYKKSLIHKYDTHGCIADLISIINPDCAIVDATIGMKGSHLSGIPVTPPINIVYASESPLEADKFGCQLLGRDWEDIRYLKMIGQRNKKG